MVSDTLNKIISAEKEAAEKIHAAEKKAEQIISEASEQASALIASAKSEGNAETEIMLAENTVRANEILRNREKAAMDEVTDIRNKAQLKKEKASDIIIRMIIS